MKIRNGFVSNSSSSSFVIYGKKFSPSEAKEAPIDLIEMTDEGLEVAYDHTGTEYTIGVAIDYEENWGLDDKSKTEEYDLLVKNKKKTNYKKLKKLHKKVMQAFKNKGVKVKDKDLCLHLGTSMLN